MPNRQTSRRIAVLKEAPVRIILPAVATVLLFVLTIFLLIIPAVENRLMEGKREMIRELTETAWSTLAFYADRAETGELSRAAARRRAAAHLRRLRYGPEAKDYFWINDLHPRMVMHPYRPDMEGRDASGFADPGGKRIFTAFVEAVEQDGAGYVDYAWQWKDDPDRIVPKISYVKAFAPWGWIVGTGIYVEDVRAEIAAMTRRLTLTCFAILLAVMALTAYIIWRGMIVTREKKRAEEQARLRQKQLFQAAKMVSLGTLVSGVAHEINNPITSVMLNTPTLDKAWRAALPILDDHRDRNGDFSLGGMPYSALRDRIPKLLAAIGDGTRRVRDIVNDLKDFAREAPAAHTDDVDANEIVRKAAGLVNNLIQKSTRHFAVRCDPAIPRFKGNAQRIEQVVINLMVNACQALPDPERGLRAATSFDSAAGEVAIEVADEGTGIPPEVLGRIKDPFFTTKRDGGGTGLGLAISDKIAGDHGGRLVFISEPGKGTTVRAIFPLTPPRPPRNQTAEQETP
jgi:signal transduction histidine kinase